MRRVLSAVVLCVGIFIVWSAGKDRKALETEQTLSDLTYWPNIPNVEHDREQIGKENACIYMLVRNYEVHEALKSIRELEDRFNRYFKYPWVFLNDEEFTDEFRILTTGMVSGHVEYGLVPTEHWSLPSHIDSEKFEQCVKRMEDEGIIYGGSYSYRHMCRFNSGFFFQHPLMLKYDWYWRVEPGVHYFCDQRYDPFKFLRENNKVYGFVISLHEVPETIPTLYHTAKSYFDNHPEDVAVDNGWDFATDFRQMWEEEYIPDDGTGYNLCHFWSNFEIGSLNFWRDPRYLRYFDHLDKTGGFFYERWGDASVHTLGLLGLANKSQIHHFSDMGYYHVPFWRCPHDTASYSTGRCLCPEIEGDNVDFASWSCLPRWWHHAGRQSLFKFNAEHANLPRLLPQHP